jgi:glycogen phosphorylase
MLHLLEIAGEPVERFADRFSVQLNDTHPSIGVAELMRLLVDERRLDWDAAWAITVATFGYTNHTLLPEALETWPLPMFAELLPRHLEIIYEINRRFLDEVRARFPGDEARVARMSHHRRGGRPARAHGASRHRRQPCRQRCRRTALRFAQGQRAEGFQRTLAGALQQQDQRRHAAALPGALQPGIARLLNRTLGDQWLTDMGTLRGLEALAENAAFRNEWRAVKQANKQRLADYIRAHTGIELDPGWLFDIQVKRIHEYKRQHLNVLHIVTLYHRLKQNPQLVVPPRAFIFGGKAAPGYFMAKRIIKLINAVAETVNGSGREHAHEGRLRAQFQRAERASRLSGRGSVRTDLHRRPRGLGHRQHEIHDERCADHRHARRRQRGDPRRSRRGELLPVRTHGRGGV